MYIQKDVTTQDTYTKTSKHLLIQASLAAATSSTEIGGGGGAPPKRFLATTVTPCVAVILKSELSCPFIQLIE